MGTYGYFSDCSFGYYPTLSNYPSDGFWFSYAKGAFWKWLNTFADWPTEPNPLTILSRAIGRVSRAVTLKQPRWRRGRWRAKS